MLQSIIKGRTVVAVQWDSLYFVRRRKHCTGATISRNLQAVKKGIIFLAVRFLELQLNFSIGGATLRLIVGTVRGDRYYPTIPPRSGGTKGGLTALTGHGGDPRSAENNDFQAISALFWHLLASKLGVKK
jgi:hypothetical protein